MKKRITLDSDLIKNLNREIQGLLDCVKFINSKFDRSVWREPCAVEYTGTSIAVKFIGVTLVSCDIESIGKRGVDMDFILDDMLFKINEIKTATDLFISTCPRPTKKRKKS